MSNNYLQEITNGHRSKGMLEESEAVTIIDDNIIKYNKFTLRAYKIKASSINVSYYNAQILKYLKKSTNLYKEVREFNQIYKFLDKMNIRHGYIKKTETPDFELYRNGKSYGIEVTKIYSGNDWVAEKMHNDIVAYKLTGQKLKDYISKSKYSKRIKAKIEDNRIKVSAIKDTSFAAEEIAHIKNKLFEKIRKQMDDYQKFDYNYIFAEIVYTGYKEIHSYEELNEEFKYLIAHLDVNFGNIEFHLILKNGNRFVDFDIKNGTYVDI